MLDQAPANTHLARRENANHRISVILNIDEMILDELAFIRGSSVLDTYEISNSSLG